MIESSAHGDDYDGVIFSQLVCKNYLLHQLFFFPCLYILDEDFIISLFLLSELDWFGWIWKLKNRNNWIKKKRRILHQQKSSDTWNCRCHTMSTFLAVEKLSHDILLHLRPLICNFNIFGLGNVLWEFVCFVGNGIICIPYYYFCFTLGVGGFSSWLDVLINWFQCEGYRKTERGKGISCSISRFKANPPPAIFS